MNRTLAYVLALGEARSCLAALAESASTLDESVRYEDLLLELDSLRPIGPALYPINATKAGLVIRLEPAVDRMLDLGEGDGLRLELILLGASGWI